MISMKKDPRCKINQMFYIYYYTFTSLSLSTCIHHGIKQSLLFYVLVIVNVYPPWYQAITFVLRPCHCQRVSTMVSSNHFCSTSLSLSTCIHHGIKQSLLFYVLVIVNVYPPWYQAITFVLRPCHCQRVSTMVSSNHFCSTSLSLSTCIHHGIKQSLLFYVLVIVNVYPPWYQAITFVLRPCHCQRVSTMVSSNHFCSTSLSLSTCIHHGIKQSLLF